MALLAAMEYSMGGTSKGGPWKKWKKHMQHHVTLKGHVDLLGYFQMTSTDVFLTPATSIGEHRPSDFSTSWIVSWKDGHENHIPKQNEECRSWLS